MPRGCPGSPSRLTLVAKTPPQTVMPALDAGIHGAASGTVARHDGATAPAEGRGWLGQAHGCPVERGWTGCTVLILLLFERLATISDTTAEQHRAAPEYGFPRPVEARSLGGLRTSGQRPWCRPPGAPADHQEPVHRPVVRPVLWRDELARGGRRSRQPVRSALPRRRAGGVALDPRRRQRVAAECRVRRAFRPHGGAGPARSAPSCGGGCLSHRLHRHPAERSRLRSVRNSVYGRA